MSPRFVILNAARNNSEPNKLRPGDEDRKQSVAVGSCFVSVCCSTQRVPGSPRFVWCLWAGRRLQSLCHVTCKEMALQTVF